MRARKEDLRTDNRWGESVKVSSIDTVANVKMRQDSKARRGGDRADIKSSKSERGLKKTRDRDTGQETLIIHKPPLNFSNKHSRSVRAGGR